jgi:hypothetical protein
MSAEQEVGWITSREQSGEEPKMLHTEPIELRFMVPQSGYGFHAVRPVIIQ